MSSALIRRTLLLLMMVLIGQQFAAAPRAETAEAIFDQANEAYEAGRFDRAADLYRSILRYRVRDPLLEYNLGNAEFRSGRLGWAILHWERALRLDPTDRDIVENLEYARSLTVDRVVPPRRPAAIEWFAGLQSRVGPDRQAWAMVMLVWLAVGIVAWNMTRGAGWSALSGWLLALSLIALLLVGLSWAVTLERIEGGDGAVVLRADVEVLAGPGENNARLAVVHEGLLVAVRGKRSGWYRVELPNGVGGWVDEAALGLVEVDE